MSRIKTEMIRARVTPEEKDRIKQNAEKAQMNVSDFIKCRCFTGQPVIVINHAPDILKHLAAISNYVNLIENTELRAELGKEIQVLWHYLNQ